MAARRRARGDYSLGALATGLRDLLVALGHDRATLVGHSLGGGIAMQFAYQFPEITERLVLVSSGGLGPEVSAILRAAALPGADLFIAATAALGTPSGRRSRVAWQSLACGPMPTSPRSPAAMRRLPTASAESPSSPPCGAFVGTGGQRLSAVDRLYLAEGVPVLIIWGARDPIIPVRHGENAHKAIPGSRLEIFEGVGHLPQLEAPGRFITALEEFIARLSRRRLTPSAGAAVSASPASSRHRSPGTAPSKMTSRHPADDRAMAG